MEFSSDPQVLAKTLPWKKPVPPGVKNISLSFDQKEMVLKRGNGNQADKPQNAQLQEIVLDNIYPSACSRHFEEKRNNAMRSVPKIGGSSTGPTQVISCVAKGTSNYLFLNGLYQKEQVTALIDVERFQVIKKLKTHKLNDMRYIQGYLVGACEESDGQVGAKAGGIVRVFRVTPDSLEEVFSSKQRYEPKYYESQMANGRILAASSKGHVAFVSADPTQIAVILMGLSKRGFNASEHTLDVKDAVHVAAERDLFIGLTKGGQLQSFTAGSTLRPHRLLNLKGDKGSTEVFTTVASASGYTVATSIQKTPTKSCFVYLVQSRSMSLLDTMPVTPDDQAKGIYPFSGVQIVQNQQAKYIVITEYFERFTLLVIKNNKLQKQISREKLFMERILGSIFVVYKKQTKSIVYGTSKFNSMTL